MDVRSKGFTPPFESELETPVSEYLPSTNLSVSTILPRPVSIGEREGERLPAERLPSELVGVEASDGRGPTSETAVFAVGADDGFASLAARNGVDK